ncbi:UPF0175 family protein [Vasconcelosia minhoensis]|uniref:UPF0175 family protein n=1 Tax=Vasconcelosia minhoensis TaxID=3366354 RepID=UPI0036F409B8
MAIIISDELVQASGLSEVELFQELVLMLYAREKLSLGKALRFSSLCGWGVT